MAGGLLWVAGERVNGQTCLYVCVCVRVNNEYTCVCVLVLVFVSACSYAYAYTVHVRCVLSAFSPLGTKPWTLMLQARTTPPWLRAMDTCVTGTHYTNLAQSHGLQHLDLSTDNFWIIAQGTCNFANINRFNTILLHLVTSHMGNKDIFKRTYKDKAWERYTVTQH